MRETKEQAADYADAEAYFWHCIDTEAKRIVHYVDYTEIIFAEVSDGKNPNHGAAWNHSDSFKAANHQPPGRINAGHYEVVKRISVLTGNMYIDYGPIIEIQYESFIIYAEKNQ